MGSSLKVCSVCGKEFAVKYRRQIRRNEGVVSFVCSDECAAELDGKATHLIQCTECGKDFELTYVYQQADLDGQKYNFCSLTCRKKVTEAYEKQYIEKFQRPIRIAVLNQKGGTGKTTTSVTVAAGLAARGEKVLLVDADSQGHVGISLDVEPEEKKTLYDIIIEGKELSEVVLPVRDNLDIVLGDSSLANCEIMLARMESGCDTVLRGCIGDNRDYSFVLLDCGPSLSLVNVNVLTFADYILIPVSCEFLSLVGVQQVLETLKRVNQLLVHPIDIIGVLPTFFDMRNKACEESYKQLTSYFGDKVLSPIRVNTRLKEASSRQTTIFDYDADSRGAKDYMKVVDFLIEFKKKKDKQLISV